MQAEWLITNDICGLTYKDKEGKLREYVVTYGDRGNGIMYISFDGGNNFNKLEIIQSDIYDYYNLPNLENGKLSIKITQGSDGDYNSGDYKAYYSMNKDNDWIVENIE